jgi:uncharacterized protein (DUF58 family)
MSKVLTDEIRAEIKEILGRVVAQTVPVQWKSSERMPGAGERRSFYRGQGDDFDGMVPYRPGDDPRKINWKAYAASGGTQVMTNVYRQITDIKAHILCDVSPSLNFGTARATKRRLAAELVASCIKSLDETKDRVGVTFYSTNNVERILKARGATSMLFPALAGVLMTQEKDGAGQGFARSLKRLPTSRSLVFIVSDFMNMTDSDWEALRSAARRHDIVCLYVQDLRERELPDVRWGWGPMGWLTGLLGCFYTLQDFTGAKRTIWVSKKTRAQYAMNFRKHESSVVSRFKEYRCRWLIVSTEEGDSAFPRIVKTLGGFR